MSADAKTLATPATACNAVSWALTWAFNCRNRLVKMGVAETEAYPVKCRQCGTPFSTRAKPGNTIRCPDCGYAQRAAAEGATAKVIQLRPGADRTWEPGCEPLQASLAAEECPDCSQLLAAEPSGTWLECPDCGRLAAPPRISRLGEHEPDGRKAPSRREMDAARRDLEEAKARAAAELRGWLPSLEAGSAGRLQSYLEDIQAADTMTRLGELSEDLAADVRAGKLRVAAEASTPAAIAQGADEYDDDDDETYIEVDGELVLGEWTDDGRLVPASTVRRASAVSARPGGGSDGERTLRAAQPPRALPAAPSPPSWGDGLSALAWRVHGTPGGCQIIDSDGQWCGEPDSPYPITDRYGQPAWICWKHKEPLTLILQRLRRSA